MQVSRHFSLLCRVALEGHTSGRILLFGRVSTEFRESAPPETEWLQTFLPVGLQFGEIHSVYLRTLRPRGQTELAFYLVAYSYY